MSHRRDSDMVEPAIAGYQLVGDSQFLRFAEQLLKKERRKSNGLAYLGLCVSGQKIGDLLRRVQDDFYPTTDRAVVMIGTNDLLQNTSLKKMCSDIEALVLELIERGVRKLILLTVPPVPRLATSQDHWLRLKGFNDRIKALHNGQDVFVVDAYSKFVKKSYRTRDSRSSSISSYSPSPIRRSSSASMLNFPILSSPSEMPTLRTNLRISVNTPDVGNKREVYVLDDGDQNSLNSSSGSVFSDTYSPSHPKRRGDFSPPPPKRLATSRTSYVEDDHDDRFADDSITTDPDLVDDINLDLFEEYFSQSSGRKDLIHLNFNGLRIIRQLIIKEVDS